ncbi:MAG: hydantoinase B/oxoprolinase family protein [Acidimicrobiia bacterium]|nr:hydantoinase B/oxoprolinase family protein [Acidimicrobiia bacterium]MDH5236598.1 hydantoinase B/oxoprolinase family protein [Acidimicrobiia bacterium]
MPVDDARPSTGWRFWVDRGGTFTDVIGRGPDGDLHVHKLLSAQTAGDAIVLGIRRVLGLGDDEPIAPDHIVEVKIGTTVATNTLLERTGSETVLVITRGFRDLLRIGHQTRPDLFALDIVLPEVLYRHVIEVDERLDADGTVLVPLDEAATAEALDRARRDGARAVAVALLHSYLEPDHERRVAALARQAGFDHTSVSHEVSPAMRLVSRGQTTVLDAYLSPTLRSYVDDLTAQLCPAGSSTRLRFMQSNGGVIDGGSFRGKDAVLSGPAGGVVGMANTGRAAGHQALIGFDMGGTSTDVSHHAGLYERVEETTVAGIPVQIPMLEIHTVAAGGGSIVHVEHGRLRVGPASAGAAPGPACYGRGGPATVTDANAVLGRIRPESFPAVFGPDGDHGLDPAASRAAFDALAGQLPGDWDAHRVAAGALQIAVEHMANAVKKISVERGHDLADYTLACFGGAGGQHACAVADQLGIDTILVHPLASVLSALGIGLADERTIRSRWMGLDLTADAVNRARTAGTEMQAAAGTDGATVIRVGLRYDGSDTVLVVPFDDASALRRRFEVAHRQRFGFAPPERPLVIERVEVETIIASALAADAELGVATDDGASPGRVQGAMWVDGSPRPVDIVDRRALRADAEPEIGPCVIASDNTTVIVEPGWSAGIDPTGTLVLRRQRIRPANADIGEQLDPLRLELFDNRFMAVAEQMGTVLEQTAVSVNIKERRDFSCAVFDGRGALVANAPHVPVHLGSMSAAVQSVAVAHEGHWRPGDTFVTNAPYDGGTHLPDITVVRPVFDREGTHRYLLAARGHHADVGGVSPGSFPAHSTSIEEEGVVIHHLRLTHDDAFDEGSLLAVLRRGPHPARSPDTNVADLRAQVAACLRGEQELLRMVDRYGEATVTAYMAHVQDNAEAAVRRAIRHLDAGHFRGLADDGSHIDVAVTPDRASGRVVVDFTGTSAQHPGNFNAPAAVARAAVLYVFRCLIDSDIALNDGCFRPIELILPPASMVSPLPPGAVVAGNVETSQLIVDSLFAALGELAAGQGTMNNIVWGTERFQYYETLCGGAGASPRYPGASAVHTHMTNSRLTDPEVIEARFPVRIEEFSIRSGSGGAGRHRGGDGVRRRIRFLDAMDVNIVSSRRIVAPHGLSGGGPGLPGRNRLIRATGRVEELAGVARTSVGIDDVLVVETPGGGAYGQAGRN